MRDLVRNVSLYLTLSLLLILSMSLSVSASGLAVAVNPQHTAIDVGENDLIQASVTGGSGTYTCAWTWQKNSRGTSYAFGANSCTVNFQSNVTDQSANDKITATATDANNHALTGSAYTIVAMNPTLTLSLTANVLTVPQDGFVSFTNVSGGGLPPYSYYYLPTPNTVIESGNSFQFTAGGNYTITEAVTDLNYAVTYSSVTISVIGTPPPAQPPALSISLNSTNSIVDEGQSVTIANATAGGTQPYSYSYNAVPSGAIRNGNTFTFPASGTYTITETATDSKSGSASNSVTIKVNPAITVTSSPITMDSGQSTVLSATASGGSGTGYSYTWYPGSSCSGTALTYLVISPNATSTYCVEVTDSLSGTGTGTENITVNPLPSVSVTSANAVDVGQQVTVNASAISGGTGASIYSWTAVGTCPGFSGASGQSFTYAPNNATSDCAFEVTVTDSIGGSGTATTPSITVSALPTVSVSPSSQTEDVGQAIEISATVGSEGSGGIAYQWYNGTSPMAGQVSNTLSLTAGATGSFAYTVIVTDSNKGMGTSEAATLTVNPLPSVSVTAPSTATSVDVGQQVTVSASAISGGTGASTYSWTAVGTCPGFSGAAGQSFTYAPTNATSDCAFEVTAIDSIGGSGTATTPSITVSALPTVSVSPSSQTEDVGQAIEISATVGGTGSGGIVYQWYNGTSQMEGEVSNTLSLIAGATGSFSYKVVVTDSNSGTGTSGTAAVTVNPEVEVTPGSATIDSGQSASLSATASGGSGMKYVYTWYLGSTCTGTPLSGTSTGALTSTTTYCVSATDSLSGAPSTGVETVTVNPPINVSGSSATIDSGQSATLSATASGGSGTGYKYTWYLGSTCAGTPLSGTSTGALTSTTTYCVSVTDSLSGAPATDVETVTVNPVITVSASSVTIDSGQSTVLSAIASGGSGTKYKYTWYLGSTCTGTPLSGTSTGVLTSTTTYCVSVTDSLSGAPATDVETVTVNPVITVSASSATIDDGQSATLSATASGGSGTGYKYTWHIGSSCTGTPLPGANTGALTSTTTYCVSVTDSLSGAPAKGVETVTVNPPIKITVSPASSTILAGQSVTLTNSTTGGTPKYAYAYTVPSKVLESGNAFTFPSTGTYTITEKATDSLSQSATNSVTVTVNPVPPGCTGSNKGAMVAITGSSKTQTVQITNQSGVSVTGSSDNVIVNMPGGNCAIALQVTGSSNKLSVYNGTATLTETGSSDVATFSNTIITSQSVTGSSDRVVGAIIKGSSFTLTGSSTLVESVDVESLNSLQITGSSANVTLDLLTTQPLAITLTGSSNLIHTIDGTVSLAITGSSNSFYYHDTTIASQKITGSSNKVVAD